MADKLKTREITITDDEGAFSVFFKRFTGEQGIYDFEGLTSLRRLLSNQRAKLLHVLKTRKPKSMYELAKLVGRDFKSIYNDIRLLERFGFVSMVSEKTGKRTRLRPVLVINNLNIHLKI